MRVVDARHEEPDRAPEHEHHAAAFGAIVLPGATKESEGSEAEGQRGFCAPPRTSWPNSLWQVEAGDFRDPLQPKFGAHPFHAPGWMGPKP